MTTGPWCLVHRSVGHRFGAALAAARPAECVPIGALPSHQQGATTVLTTCGPRPFRSRASSGGLGPVVVGELGQGCQPTGHAPQPDRPTVPPRDRWVVRRCRSECAPVLNEARRAARICFLNCARTDSSDSVEFREPAAWQCPAHDGSGVRALLACSALLQPPPRWHRPSTAHSWRPRTASEARVSPTYR